MSKNRSRRILILLICALSRCPVQADGSREQSVAGILAQRLPAAEIIELRAAGDEFIGLYREQTAARERGAIILVHSMGGHPDWPDVISPLRTSLPAAGWTTLSVQMPLLAPETPIAEYGKTLHQAGNRLGAAVQYLRDRHYPRVVVLGHSFGAATAAWYVTRDAGTGVDALVAVSILAQRYLSPRLKILDMMKAIDIPLLDIYGQDDYDAVLAGAGQRRLAGRHNRQRIYQQIRIEDADHLFTGRDAVLGKAIITWLDEVLPERRPATNREPMGNKSEGVIP